MNTPVRCYYGCVLTDRNQRRLLVRAAWYGSLVLMLVWITTRQALGGHPIGLEIDPHVMRSGEKGDNWCVTWGADGALYTAQCDGRGWLDENGEMREFKNTQIWRITGGPDSKSFKAEMMHGPRRLMRT